MDQGEWLQRPLTSNSNGVISIAFQHRINKTTSALEKIRLLFLYSGLHSQLSSALIANYMTFSIYLNSKWSIIN